MAENNSTTDGSTDDISPSDVNQAIAQQNGSPPPDSTVSSCPQDQTLTWIQIRLMDMEGNMVKNERYRITDSTGAKHEGRLDGAGQANVDGIKPGTCQITFPDRDEEAWDRV